MRFDNFDWHLGVWVRHAVIQIYTKCYIAGCLADWLAWMFPSCLADWLADCLRPAWRWMTCNDLTNAVVFVLGSILLKDMMKIDDPSIHAKDIKICCIFFSKIAEGTVVLGGMVVYILTFWKTTMAWHYGSNEEFFDQNYTERKK